MSARYAAGVHSLRIGTVHLLYAALGAAVLLQTVTGRLETWTAAIPLALGWIMWMAVRRAGDASRVLRVYVLVMLVAAVIAIVKLVVGLPLVLGDDHAFYALKARITTPVGDHNELAAWLLVALVFAAGAEVTAGSNKRPLLDHARRPVLVLLALGLGATLSRGALVAGLVGVVVGWLLGLDRAMLRRSFAGLVLAGAIVLGAVAMLDTTVPTDGPTSSAAARIDLWGVALDDIRDDPALGVGLGSFEDTAANVAGPHHHAHNGTLHALAELGLVAGLAAAVRLPWATWVLLRRRDDRWLRVAGLGGLLMLVHDQVEALALQAVSEVVIGGLMALAVRPEAKTAAVPS